MQKIRLTGLIYGLDFDQWLMPVSQSIYAAGYFIHVKTKTFFWHFFSLNLLVFGRSARVVLVRQKITGKKVVFSFVEPGRNYSAFLNLRPSHYLQRGHVGWVAKRFYRLTRAMWSRFDSTGGFALNFSLAPQPTVYYSPWLYGHFILKVLEICVELRRKPCN